uniref:protein NLP2-like n=1 Tax=Erigeron canadensis TaxID=72917 RepID=UPI001CB95239|nr:protein NLP2-like [Erigeron canadensis]XP_043614046.1 protein NLP2-like [Erigeron canadensis]
MNDNVFTFDNSSDSLMDFDYMDELLLDGCWLQTTDGSEISNKNTSVPNPLFEPSSQWPKLESDMVPNDIVTPGINSPKSHVKNLITLPNQSENLSESSKRWWIAPSPSISVMERLIYAIDNIKNYTVDKNVLIQVWLPETIGGKKFLSTSQRLFSLELKCPRLSNYRNISKTYHFPAEGDAKESVGLPGRVFKEKVPEWTPDVRLFNAKEYPRVSHAQQHGVSGSVAVPVFDQDVKDCIGVFELIMTSQKSNYSLEIQSVCKALEAVDLRSSEDSNSHKINVSNGFYHPALPEIFETLKSACIMHNLPLAQTWIPCIQQGSKGGCRHSNENLIRCISTVDSASYVSNRQFKDFQEACSEHHLFVGQGVVGKAFLVNEPCYSSDVTSYTKTDYPLAHHAKIFDLHAAVAIRLRSIYGVTVDFVLEFFLPIDCKTDDGQKGLISSLLNIIQKVCGSLRIVTEMELQEDGVNEGLLISDTEQISKVQETDNHCPSSGSGSGTPIEKRRVGAKLEKTITLEMLRQHFAGSLKDAAKNMGVCPTTLKRICRQHGIQRWPSRKIKKVGHSLRKIQLVMDSVHGGSGSFQIESFYSNFPKLASPDPSKQTRSPFSTKNRESSDLKAADGATAVTSCSPSSSSSHSLSGGTHHVQIADEDTGEGTLKRTKSDAGILTSNASNIQNQEPKIFLRSHSHKSLNEPLKLQNLPPKPRIKPEGHLWRVKVTFGEEKIRFRMQKDWGYNELMQEIAIRFSLNDVGGYSLKYLDDDSEWVLLTCDADVEECIDVYRSFKGGTIRLVLREPQLGVGSSLGSNAPLS